jgi:hypothetical protein
MKNKIKYEEHILNLDTLYQIILDEKIEYFSRYHREPTYVKIPTWVYVCLTQQCRNIVGFEFHDNIEKLFGFIIIETPTIDNIYEIELL